MPAARYWRVVGLSTAGAPTLALSAIRIYNRALDRIDGGAVITCPQAPAAGTLASLQDDDLSTTAQWPAAQVSAPGFHIAFDLGSDVDVAAVRFGSGAERAQFLRSCELQYLQGGVWSTTARTASMQWPGPNSLLTPTGSASTAAIHLTGDGVEGAGVIEDIGTLGVPITKVGTVITSNSPAKFGQALKFDAAGHLHVSHPSFAVGTGDFSFRWWQFADSVALDPGAFQLSTTPGGLTTSTSSVSVLRSTGNVWFIYFGSVYNTGVPHPGPGVWTLVEFLRQSGVVKLVVNGVLVWQLVSSYNVAGTHLAVGGYYSTTYQFPGSLDDFSYTPGEATFDGDYEVPTGPYAGVSMLGAAGTFDATPQRHGAMQYVDTLDGGAYWVVGSTKNTGTPDVPVRRRVRLHEQRSGRLVRETWSNADTGAYVFERVAMGKYYVTAFDHTGTYSGVVETDITPEPMP